MVTGGLYLTSKLAQQHETGNHTKIYRYIIEFAARSRKLSPGARSLLYKVHEAMEARSFTALSRPEIAAALQHKKMHRWDLKLMDELIAVDLIKVKRVPLSTYSSHKPRGAEYRYWMSIEVGWLVSHHRNR